MINTEEKKIKNRLNCLNKLLSEICHSPYVLSLKTCDNGYIIEPISRPKDGVSFKQTSYMSLFFNEKWEEISGQYVLTEYLYQIKFLKEWGNNKFYRLFGYELHPKIENISFEHINFNHPTPFGGEIHYYNESINPSYCNLKEEVFESMVFRTIKEQILSKEIVENLENYIMASASATPL
jgi:hypothetical protein